jgi:hypothetical protein
MGLASQCRNKRKVALALLAQDGTAVPACDDEPEPMAYCVVDDRNVRVRHVDIFGLDLAGLSVNRETISISLRERNQQ